MMVRDADPTKSEALNRARLFRIASHSRNVGRISTFEVSARGISDRRLIHCLAHCHREVAPVAELKRMTRRLRQARRSGNGMLLPVAIGRRRTPYHSARSSLYSLRAGSAVE